MSNNDQRKLDNPAVAIEMTSNPAKQRQKSVILDLTDGYNVFPKQRGSTITTSNPQHDRLMNRLRKGNARIQSKVSLTDSTISVHPLTRRTSVSSKDNDKANNNNDNSDSEDEFQMHPSKASSTSCHRFCFSPMTMRQKICIAVVAFFALLAVGIGIMMMTTTWMTSNTDPLPPSTSTSENITTNNNATTPSPATGTSPQPDMPSAACIDITCNNGGTCVNMSTSYQCLNCNPGFIANGTNAPCSNINECTSTTNVHDCHTSALCTDTQGSFTCACNQGYLGIYVKSRVHNFTFPPPQNCESSIVKF